MKKMKKILIATLTLFLVCIPFSQVATKVEAAGAPRVFYQVSIQKQGWQGYVENGQTAGTTGKRLSIEAVRLTLTTPPVPGDLSYVSLVENRGWLNKKASNQMSGTEGKGLRMEAIKINITGELRNHYDVYYRTHVQNYGWLAWAKNGESAGSAGKSLRMEALEVKLVKKGDPTPETGRAFIG